VAALVEDARIPISSEWMYEGPGVVDHRATEAVRGTAKDVWNPQMILQRGYGLALFYNGDVEPDVPGTQEGVRAHLVSAAPPHNWGTIAAWAWGAQRVVDYLTQDSSVDAGRIAVVGHSRNGKAALLAAAMDERIAMAFPVQAGCGGTAPSRGRIGESVRQINSSFPHWFCDAFKEFNDHPEKLPFDQNGLVALMAPRPVLFTNASEDQWANPAGQFEVLKAADPVYRFLGVDGLGAATMPAEGIPAEFTFGILHSTRKALHDACGLESHPGLCGSVVTGPIPCLRTERGMRRSVEHRYNVGGPASRQIEALRGSHSPLGRMFLRRYCI
jgi:hypothetical protein